MALRLFTWLGGLLTVMFLLTFAISEWSAQTKRNHNLRAHLEEARQDLKRMRQLAAQAPPRLTPLASEDLPEALRNRIARTSGLKLTDWHPEGVGERMGWQFKLSGPPAQVTAVLGTLAPHHVWLARAELKREGAVMSGRLVVVTAFKPGE